jgi:hypothetical protein
MRALAGSIRDWDRLLEQAMTSLLPNGWLEVQEFAVWIYADDGSMERAPTVRRWQENLIEASKLFGKPMNIVHQHKSRMEAAGFVDVTEDVYKVRAPLRCVPNPVQIDVDLLLITRDRSLSLPGAEIADSRKSQSTSNKPCSKPPNHIL